MNTEQKEKLKKAHSKTSSWLQSLGVPANWAKVLAGVAVGAALGGLCTCQQSCKNTPCVNLTVEQIQAAEGLYTAAGGEVKYRIVPVVDYKK